MDQSFLSVLRQLLLTLSPDELGKVVDETVLARRSANKETSASIATSAEVVTKKTTMQKFTELGLNSVRKLQASAQDFMESVTNKESVSLKDDFDNPFLKLKREQEKQTAPKQS